MSLHDVDKNSDDRGSPTPNTHDKIIDGAHKSHATISTHYSSDADQSNTRLQMQNKQIIGSNATSQIVNYGVQTDGKFALKFFDANGVGVARFGQYADGTIALKVAKSGQEVDTATGNNLIFNSSQDVFKIVSTGSLTQTLTNTANTVPAGTQTITIPHNLGFQPAFMVYVSTPSTYISGAVLVVLPEAVFNAVGSPLGSGTLFSQFKARVDATNLYVDFYHRVGTDYSPSAPTFGIKYYILQETAA